MNSKLGFDDFITAVGVKEQDCVRKLHDKLTEHGCKIEVKTAKSGYMVSYILDKKTIANYVFRKKGLIARIYANHINRYEEVLDTLPDEMVRTIRQAPDCKRLLDPEACNSRCSRGYDFYLKGERQRKCRNNAFLFLVSGQNAPFIETMLMHEVKAYKDVEAFPTPKPLQQRL